jgi:hypothetical protein
MLRMICLSFAAGVIALTAAVPVAGAGSVALAEPRAMLLTATTFFVLASAMRWRWKGPRRP